MKNNDTNSCSCYSVGGVEFSLEVSSSSRVNRMNVSGKDIDKIIKQVILRIRPVSKEFYEKELRRDLEKNGESIVDCHAGCGTLYKVTLQKRH